MDPDDRRLFEDILRKTTEAQTGEALDAALRELGWHDALSDDAHVAVSTLFRLQGLTNATSTALDDVLLAALDVPDAEGAAVVLPRLGHSEPPASAGAVDGVATRRIEVADRVLVVSADGALVTTPDALQLRTIGGIDPDLGLVEVRGDANGVIGDEVQWPGVVAAGQLALAHEVLGAAAAMLQLARDHAVQRIQFGRAIASFQAVRHRLADALVAVEAADAAVGAAWEDPSPLAAAVAKAIAGRSARTVARHAQQVLGGMGFTTEHPLHRYVRRMLALDQLLGSSRLLTRQLGEEILHRRQLPTMLPL